MGEKLIKITTFNPIYNDLLGTSFQAFYVYRSKGLLTHLIKRKHMIAIKYVDCLPEIISFSDFIGCCKGNIEMIKTFKDNIYISIRLDSQHNRYYVATMFDVKIEKIESYLKSGRIKRVPKTEKHLTKPVSHDIFMNARRTTSRKGTLRSHWEPDMMDSPPIRFFFINRQ